MPLTATNIKDFSQVSFTVVYNPSEVEVLDLCSTTTEVNLTTGYIIGTDITIASFIPGTIKFTVNKPIESDKTWAGVTNNIEFKGKINGQTSITYTVE